MAATIGRKVKLYVGTASPLGSVGGVQEKNLTLNSEPIDITSDDDNGWRAVLAEPGQHEVGIKLSGVVKDDTLLVRWFNLTNKLAMCRLVYPNGAEIEGSFYMSSYNRNNSYKEAVTFDCDLISNGVITFTPAA